MASQAERPPIEVVAARLRELRQAAIGFSASSDGNVNCEAELRRIADEYDDWLLVAAAQVGVELDDLEFEGSLPLPVRSKIEQGVVSAGWQLDG